jgi:MATE family multidrug resistance protein
MASRAAFKVGRVTTPETSDSQNPSATAAPAEIAYAEPLKMPAIEPLPTGAGVPKALLLLAIPIIFTMISRTIMGFTDFIFVSHLGTEAQAAIMPANIFVFALISFGMGVITAVNTFAAQSFGAQRFRDCSSYAWQGVYISALYGAILFPVWFFLPAIFHAAGHSPATQQMEITFTRISILGIFPAIATMALADFFSAIHKPSIGLWSTIIANIFNAIANYVLIFGKLGFPEMGIAGSAIGTLLATILQTLILACWLILPKYHAKFQSRHTWRVDFHKCWQLIKVGAPAGIQFMSDIFCFTIFTMFLVGGFGTAQLAANNLVFQLLQVSFMPTVGLSVAVTASVGKAIGMGNKKHARLVARWGMTFALIYMGGIGLLYVTMPHTLSSLLSPDTEVQYWAVRVLYLCAVFQLFDAIGITHAGALRGAGDNWIQAIFSILYGLIIFLPGGYLLSHYMPHWGILGPWTAATVFIILVCSSLTLRWKFGPWEKIDLLNDKSPKIHIEP